MNRVLVIATAALLGAGCGKSADTSTTAPTTGTPGPGPGPGPGTTDSAPGDTGTDPIGSPPTVSAPDAVCYDNSSHTPYFYWLVSCSADDPDGQETLAEYASGYEHTVTVLQGGSQVASYPLVCSETGLCTGTFLEADDGVLCNRAGDYTFRFVVYDEDGNASEPVDVLGRQG